jgi:hypothetical protein
LAIHEGELVLFPETAGHPVEWAVLGRDPAHPGQVLVVPADTNTKAGTADVEATGSVAPLTLRCAFGVWITEARAAAAPRSEGTLSPEDVSAAKRLWEAKERGEPVGSLLAEEVDADPDYRDWIEDVLIPARDALTKVPVIPIRRRPHFFGNPYALAASVLLMVTLGLTGGLLWQDQRLDNLASERARTEKELRQERERLAQVEEQHRRQLTEAERRAEEARRQDRERIAELERRLKEETPRPGALLNVPLVGLGPKDPVRGEIEEVILPEGVDLFFLLLSITDPRRFPTYRLEVADKETGRVVWKGEGLKASEVNEVSLALPRDVLLPSDYRLRLYGLKDGKAEEVGEYEVRIVHQ